MATFEVNIEEIEPMSRTYQYRKVMKPMLERKRRARINKCLDELKDLMVSALQSEGESITKLEKADVLELTVRHLRKLKQHHALVIPAQNHSHEKFKAGFGHCASEVRKFVQAVPGVDMHISARLLNHLGQWMSQMEKMAPLPSLTTSTTITSPIPASPVSPSSLTLFNAPRVYTPPASPDDKPLPLLPANTLQAPQSLALVLTSHQPCSYTISTNSTLASSVSSIQHHPSAQMPSTSITTSHSTPVLRKIPSTVIESRKPTKPGLLPINYSQRPTGIKAEHPQVSLVWRPW